MENDFLNNILEMFLYIDPLKQGLKRERNSGKRD